MKLIDVSTPKFPNTFAKVDDEDYERVTQCGKWSAEQTHRIIYALRPVIVNGKKTTVRMHSWIIGGRSPAIDHKDHDGLNNQRANLRVCTDRQNGQNRIKTHGNSQFKGVCWDKRFLRWKATIVAPGVPHHIGYFDCEGCAAIAYDKAARAAFGEFACPNF